MADIRIKPAEKGIAEYHAEMQESESAEAAPGADLTPREIAIPVEWPEADDSGKVTVRRGELVSRVPQGPEHQQMERLTAISRGGLPASSFDRASQGRQWTVARCLIQVVNPPNWFTRAVDNDPEFAGMVSEVLEEHERRFRRGVGPSGGGTERYPTVESPFSAPADGKGEARPDAAG